MRKPAPIQPRELCGVRISYAVVTGYDMEARVNKNLLLYAVMRLMFCPGCESVLDVRRSVQFDCNLNGKVVRTKTICADCFDRGFPKVAETVSSFPGMTITIIDGREPKLTEDRIERVGRTA